KGDEKQPSKRSKRQQKKAGDEEQIKEKSDGGVKDMAKSQGRKAKTPLEPVPEEKSDKSPVKKESRLRKQAPETQAGPSKGISTNDAAPDVPEVKKTRRVRNRKENLVNEDPVPEKRPTRTRGKTPVQKPEASEIKSQPLRKRKNVTKNSEKQDVARDKGKATGSRGEAKAQDSDTFESDTPQKTPLEVNVVVHHPSAQLSESDEELSDKENKVRQNVSTNSEPDANTSVEKKPIYKILGSKANPVALDQLIVMEDAAAGETSGVYDFSLSQNGASGKDAKKKRKRRRRIVMPKKVKTKRIWSDKEVNRAKKKMTVTQMKMEKLQSIPAHIREKVRDKEKLKNRQSLHASTPLKTVQRMDVANVISPIHQTDEEFVERPASETHEIDNDMDDSRFVENLSGDKTTVDPPRKDDVQPWRTDEAHSLPTTSHVRHSDHDFLPTFSSDVIIKATPKKPKPPPRTPQTKSNDLDHSDPGPSSLPEKTFRISPASKSAENVNTEQNIPDKEDPIFNYTLENFFGFETENTLEVDVEIAEKHGEDALRKERERLKALAPPKKKVKIEKVTPVRRGKRVQQQLTIKEAIPSTSRQPHKKTPDEDIFEPEKPDRREKRAQKLTSKEAIPSTSRQPPKEAPDENIFASDRPEPRKSYSRPKARQIENESSDDSDEEKPPQTVEEEGEEIMKKYQKKTKTKSKAKVKVKDLKQQQELEEFCTSFNEMCDEVEQFEMLVE
uniref:Uncharacterized protein n=1 Tax=Phlebotomus papatasi TaxID=29031 RepID=A0A1B0DFX5_PHLPP